LSNLRELSKDTAIYGFGSVLKKAIGLFLIPFYTRALSPGEFGILDILGTFSFFIMVIVGLGMDGATGRYFFIADNEKEKGKVLYTSVIIRIISNVVPVVGLSLFAGRLSHVLFDSDKYTWAIVFTLLTIPILNISKLQDLLFRYYRQPWKFTLVSSVRAIVSPTFGILLVVVLQWSVFGATLASLVSSLVVLLFAYFYYARKRYYREFNWYWAKKMLKFGYPLIFTGMLVWVNSVSDRFFLLHYSSLEQIGFYSIGNIFSQPIQLINLALTLSATVLIMSLFSEEADENKPKTKEFLTKIWYTYLFFGISIAVLISVFSYEIVNFITTPEYIMGILAIPFLSFSLILSQSTQITGNGMTLMEMSKPYVWIMLIAAGINVGLNFYFIPRHGFVGAGFTTIVSNFVYFGVAYFWSQKYFYIKRSFMKPMLYFLFSLMIALFFPFAQLKFNLMIPLWSKMVICLVTPLSAFIFGLVKVEMIKNIYSKFKIRLI